MNTTAGFMQLFFPVDIEKGPMNSTPQIKHRIKGMVILLAMLLWVGCSSQDDTQAVNELIIEGAQHSEAHRIRDLLALTTSDYVTLPGHYNRGTTRGLLYRAFRYYGNFKIYYPRPSIKVEPNANRSTVMMYFMLVRQNLEFPDLRELAEDPPRWLKAAQKKADLYQLKLSLVKMKKQWLVEQATIHGFKGIGF